MFLAAICSGDYAPPSIIGWSVLGSSPANLRPDFNPIADCLLIGWALIVLPEWTEE